MSEIEKLATSIYVPELPYPKAIAREVAAYEAAHAAWRDAYAVVVAADARLNAAPALDAAALVESVAAGKGHPGQAKEAGARADLAVAEEKCRVAREAATAQTDMLRAVLSSATEELVPIVLASIRKAAEAYDVVATEAQARVTTARDALVTALGHTRMVKPFIQTHYGVTTGLQENVNEPQWRPPVAPAINYQLDFLEKHIEQAISYRAGKPA